MHRMCFRVTEAQNKAKKIPPPPPWGSRSATMHADGTNVVRTVTPVCTN